MSDPSTWPSAAFKSEDHWPRLTESLDGPREPFACQACGRAVEDPPKADDAALTRTVWQECDRFDRPEPGRYLVLCRPCARDLIDPHPRLYHALSTHQPAAGTLALCLDCKHRDGVRCANPAARSNGGEGILITGPRPSRAHIQYADTKGRRCGRWEELYPGPAKDCSGREAAE